MRGGEKRRELYGFRAISNQGSGKSRRGARAIFFMATRGKILGKRRKPTEKSHINDESSGKGERKLSGNPNPEKP